MGGIRKASEHEYWTAIQRIWTFEEPSSRWARLYKSAAKIAQSTYTFDTDGKWLQCQDVLFREIYGPADYSSCYLSACFAAFYALAEIERYDDGAFTCCAAYDVWDEKKTVLRSGSTGREVDAGTGESQLLKTLLRHIIGKRDLSIHQASFLQYCVWSTPDWTRMLKDGPWNGDSRVDFIRTILKDPLNVHLLNSNNCVLDGHITDHLTKFEAVFHNAEKMMRSQLPSSFLPKRILLVEGATEQILLPHFAQCIAPDWKERAVLIIPAGGANQVVKRYPSLRAHLRLPIDCLLDGDVRSQAQRVANQLSDGDRLYILESGAIEEAFPRHQIVDLVNTYFDSSGVGLIFTPVTLQELDSTTNQESMEKLWRKRNRGSFDKTGFAKVVAESITTEGQIPPEIRNLIYDLCAH